MTCGCEWQTSCYAMRGFLFSVFFLSSTFIFLCAVGLKCCVELLSAGAEQGRLSVAAGLALGYRLVH